MLNNFKVLNKFFRLVDESILQRSIFVCYFNLLIIKKVMEIEVVDRFWEGLYVDFCERMYKSFKFQSVVMEFNRRLSLVQYIFLDDNGILFIKFFEQVVCESREKEMKSGYFRIDVDIRSLFRF